MSKVRIRFEKKGTAKYISHLDLMRTMQRVFVRTGIKIKHTEGFNPHPYIVFGLPLSVGAESECEMMDFDLRCDISLRDIPERLNRAMPEGITVKEAYETETKFKDMLWLRVEGELIYDEGAVCDKLSALEKLFAEKELIIKRKTKKGMGEANIIPMISKIEFKVIDEKTLKMYTLIHAQEPTLNPSYLYEAIKQHVPEAAPDFFRYERKEFYDGNMKIFR